MTENPEPDEPERESVIAGPDHPWWCWRCKVRMPNWTKHQGRCPVDGSQMVTWESLAPIRAGKRSSLYSVLKPVRDG